MLTGGPLGQATGEVEIELRRGGAAVDSKTNPSFKVSVPKVSAPTTQTESIYGLLAKLPACRSGTGVAIDPNFRLRTTRLFNAFVLPANYCRCPVL